jgi:hypothetical protein
LIYVHDNQLPVAATTKTKERARIERGKSVVAAIDGCSCCKKTWEMENLAIFGL